MAKKIKRKPKATTKKFPGIKTMEEYLKPLTKKRKK